MTLLKASHCGQDHRLHDGVPIGHACVIIPSQALHEENAGNLDAARAVVEAALPLRSHRGVSPRIVGLGLKSLAEVESEQVRLAVTVCGWNMCRAADTLGVDRRTLYRMLQRHGIVRPVELAPDFGEDRP